MKIDNLPVGVRKKIKYIIDAKCYDTTNNSQIYLSDKKYMEDSEEVYENFSRNQDDPEDSILKILSVVLQNVSKSLYEYEQWVQMRCATCSSKAADTNRTKTINALAEFYNSLGNVMDELGILRTLINRTNQVFQDEGLDELKLSRKQALEEYDIKFNSRYKDFSILFLKNAYALNKIVKFVERFEYGSMLQLDANNSKTNNDSRIKFMSKQKTDFLRKVIENCSEEDMNFYQYQEIYQNLFGDDFRNLDFAEDYRLVSDYEEAKKALYHIKTIQISNGITDLLIYQDRNRSCKHIKSWGCCKDSADGSYVFGINLTGYMSGLTFHLQKQDIESMNTAFRRDGFYTTKFPLYKVMRKSNGKVLSTNALFRPNPKQLECIKRMANERLQNRVLQFFKAQCCSSQIEPPKDYILLENML